MLHSTAQCSLACMLGTGPHMDACDLLCARIQPIPVLFNYVWLCVPVVPCPALPCPLPPCPLLPCPALSCLALPCCTFLQLFCLAISYASSLPCPITICKNSVLALLKCRAMASCCLTMARLLPASVNFCGLVLSMCQALTSATLHGATEMQLVASAAMCGLM